jgi:transcriptional regulator with XRE-family HTH domain
MTGEQFRRCRKLLYETQEAAADGLGVTQPTIARWENGTHPVPRIAVILIEKLLESLAVETAEA